MLAKRIATNLAPCATPDFARRSGSSVLGLAGCCWLSWSVREPSPSPSASPRSECCERNPLVGGFNIIYIYIFYYFMLFYYKSIYSMYFLLHFLFFNCTWDPKGHQMETIEGMSDGDVYLLRPGETPSRSPKSLYSNHYW